MSGLDLAQLQAELELKRSALADSILSKLPGLSSPSPASSSNPAPPQNTNGRPRQANLGLGATPKNPTTGEIAANGKARSAADLRLKGALTAKRKRWQDQEPSTSQASDDDQEVGRADAISAKKAKQVNGGANATAGKDGKSAKKDPFAAKGIEQQKAAQNQPRIVIVDGEEVDLSKLSKTQRKKINKQLKAQREAGTASNSNTTNDDEQVVKPTSSASSTIPASTISKATSQPTPKLATTTSPAKPAAQPAPALTALQAQMLSKLSGSRFRTINEKLYTTASTEAVSMIDASPAMFDEYHAGFREQVKSWPKNPLDRIAELFFPSSSSSSSSTPNAKGKNKAKSQAPTGSTVSKFTKAQKARFTQGALVVDLGAGEGGLAKKLNPRGVKVLCYDLVATPDGWVRKQDTAAVNGLPLPGYFDGDDPLGLQKQQQPEGVVVAEGVADVAVFCLSLMGTNWVHMLLEAKRVLRVGGELIVAEVSSRFDGGFEEFVKVVKMLGFGLESQDSKNTHFVLFEFTKLDHAAHVKSLRELGEMKIDPHNVTLEELAEHGKTLLKPCIYKRR